ncbi:MAG: FMN-binding glutamate synthase family protein [Vulcanimicrobiota bacterium]
MRHYILSVFVGLSLLVVALGLENPSFWWGLLFTAPLSLLAIRDYFQPRHTILRNFPVLGHLRYLAETIRPGVQQYFIENESDGRPFSKEQRSLVYQRSKSALDTRPFGTQRDVYEVGYEWVNHSMVPVHVDPESLRTKVGGPDCTQPYECSLLNISAMSYGSLSKNAILALNGGAKDGHFAHNTGEGGVSPYHLSPGGDLVWQIGTGYFGCRAPDGGFCADKFTLTAKHPQIKMIEIKLSQGAKPGHGGILPAKKVTKEISEIRGVPMGQDVLSPPGHRAFNTPIELMQFIRRCRSLCEGKPVGIKLCLGKRREFVSLCKAMLKTGIAPDFIVVDGGEGGTGAAPLEFTNRIGTPGVEGLIFVHNTLVGFGLRDKVKVGATGKVYSAFCIAKMLALGADFCLSARAMMLALGCIQALVCNTNTCPTGIATQKKDLMGGLVITDKRKRVATFHKETLESLAEMVGAMGLQSWDKLRPWHILRRISVNETRHYGELYDFLDDGELLNDELPKDYERAVRASSADDFAYHGPTITKGGVTLN